MVEQAPMAFSLSCPVFSFFIFKSLAAAMGKRAKWRGKKEMAEKFKKETKNSFFSSLERRKMSLETVIVIDEEDERRGRGNEPFFVGAYDPGTKAGALVRVNLATFRVVEGTPVSLSELKKGRKAIQKEPTYDELSHCLRELARGVEHKHFFRRVVIEKQMKDGKLQTVAVALSTLLGKRATMSSMRSVRSHYGISVSEKDMKARSKKGRRDQAYAQRKKLSIKMVETSEDSPIHEDDLEELFEVASEYWEQRAESYGIEGKGDLNRRIRKAYSDLVEAAIHALFPGNWSDYVDTELSMHGEDVEKFSDNLARAHKQRAKLLEKVFGFGMDQRESLFLPMPAILKYLAFAKGDESCPKKKTCPQKPSESAGRSGNGKKQPSGARGKTDGGRARPPPAVSSLFRFRR